MMGVYIKGMEMPKEGEWISVNIFHDGKCFVQSWCGMDLNFAAKLTAVPVPPHGRMIDADALPTDIEWEDILDAPTVIEADVSEEELQREYEANVEYAQYCERYEQTYDPNTGAM